MDSSIGNFVDVPGRPIPGLEDKPSKTQPDPQRVAIALEMVDAWWESRNVSAETKAIGGEA